MKSHNEPIGIRYDNVTIVERIRYDDDPDRPLTGAERARRHRARRRGEVVPARRPGPRKAKQPALPPPSQEVAVPPLPPAVVARRAIDAALDALAALRPHDLRRDQLMDRLLALIERCEDLRMQEPSPPPVQPHPASPPLLVERRRASPPPLVEGRPGGDAQAAG